MSTKEVAAVRRDCLQRSLRCSGTREVMRGHTHLTPEAISFYFWVESALDS